MVHEVALSAQERLGIGLADDRAACLVFSENTPRPRPRRGLSVEQQMNPTQFLQTFSAVFVVGRVVAKLYAIAGEDAEHPLRRSDFLTLIRTSVEVILAHEMAIQMRNDGPTLAARPSYAP